MIVWMPYKNPFDPRAKLVRRKHYYKNKQKYLEQKEKRKQLAKDLIIELKSVPCADCGQTYPPYVMDFDHQEDKEFIIALAPTKGYSLERIRREVEKCEIVCSNCHRIRTFNRDNS